MIEAFGEHFGFSLKVDVKHTERDTRARAHVITHILHHFRVGRAEMNPSTACFWSLGVRGQSGLRSWLCTCQGQEPVLKKEPRRNQ